MKLLTNNEINIIEKRCNEISSEKWEVYKVMVGDVTFYDVVTNGGLARPNTKEECEFIANARTDIPKLLEHIKYLQSMLHNFQQSQIDGNRPAEALIGHYEAVGSDPHSAKVLKC